MIICERETRAMTYSVGPWKVDKFSSLSLTSTHGQTEIE